MTDTMSDRRFLIAAIEESPAGREALPVYRAPRSTVKPKMARTPLDNLDLVVRYKPFVVDGQHEASHDVDD